MYSKKVHRLGALKKFYNSSKDLILSFDYVPNTLKKIVIKLDFFLRHRYWANLKSPKTFSEKLMHRKLVDNKNRLFVLCADKYAVRKYVQEKIGSEYLVPLIDVVKNADDLKLENYGKEFVVKGNHDCESVTFVRDGQFDKDSIIKKMKNVLMRDYGRVSAEPWYSEIEPRILVEKLLVDKNGNSPTDYKFHVFRKNNEINIITQFDYYDENKKRHISFYTEDGKLHEFEIAYPSKRVDLEKPSNYEKMLTLAKKLSEDFDYVRVDLYDLDGEIYFSELTLCHASGLFPVRPQKYDAVIGSYWQLKAQ